MRYPRRNARAFTLGFTPGFTLIEVLVALVVVAFGMGALMASLTSAADAVGRLREKSLAEWIALNRVTEVRIQRGAGAASTGKKDGDVDYGGGRWHWEQEIVDSGLPGLMRVDVHVRRAGATRNPKGGWTAEATGFMGTADVRPQSGSPNWYELPQGTAGPGPNPQNPQNPAPPSSPAVPAPTQPNTSGASAQ